jgi:hypothetical protein
VIVPEEMLLLVIVPAGLMIRNGCVGPVEIPNVYVSPHTSVNTGLAEEPLIE